MKILTHAMLYLLPNRNGKNRKPECKTNKAKHATKN